MATKTTTDPLPDGIKRAIVVMGIILALPGLLVALGFCVGSALLLIEGDGEPAIWGVIGVTAMALTLGAGGITAWHGAAALRQAPSRTVRLPAIWAQIGIFGLAIAMGFAARQLQFTAVLAFPPVVLIAAMMPPLWAIAWFTQGRTTGLTWRRGIVAFAGGATLGVFLALILEILLPTIVLALVQGLADRARTYVDALVSALAGDDIASAITDPSFLYLFVQLAIIAPLAEELAKPVVTLPLLRRVSKREAFLIGAATGAGFAALENVLYAAGGLSLWAGILILRALGGAIHPLGSGVVTMGWHAIQRREPGAWRTWLKSFAVAVGIHALWNGGILIVITLAGAQFFGQLPSEVEVFGLSAAGTTLAMLIILGLGALWLGRRTAERSAGPPTPDAPATTAPPFTVSDRTLAIWALACLVTLVPAGITGLRLWMR